MAGAVLTTPGALALPDSVGPASVMKRSTRGTGVESPSKPYRLQPGGYGPGAARIRLGQTPGTENFEAANGWVVRRPR
jgi:hypothetical protein